MSGALRILIFFAAMAAAIFGPAGRLDLPFVWGVLGIYAMLMLAAYWRMDPDLRRERFRPGAGGEDRNLRLIALPLMAGSWVVAGLDVGRFHWSDTVPRGVQAGALVGFVLAFSLAAWAMTVNRFFSPVVRIQTERGHHVIKDGPYRYVRHPGSLGSVGCFGCGTLALGSWWAMVPALACVLLVLRRTAIEDRYLRKHLEGYAAFAEKVRYRLMPGVW